MLVWRYMSFKYGVQSAMTGRFKLARVQDLNDLYEMRGACVGTMKPSVEAEMMSEIVKRYSATPSVNKDGLQKRDIEAVLKDVKTRYTQMMNYVCFCRETYEERQRVLCFTDASIVDNNSDLLLWGHYADKGRGVRVLADLPEDYIIGNVKYSEQRPVLDLSALNTCEDLDAWGQFIMDSVFTKGLGWSYEHEVRLVTSKDASGVVSENGLDFIDFGVSSIHCIDFGPLTRRKEIDAVFDGISNTKALKHIRCRIASFSKFRYQYDYIDYPQ